MSNNTEFKKPIMFTKNDHVIFKPINPYSDSETPQKYEAIIYNNSQEDKKIMRLHIFLDLRIHRF